MIRLNSCLVSSYATISRFPSNDQQRVAEQLKMELTESIESLAQAYKLRNMKAGFPDKLRQERCAERMQVASIGGH